MKHFLFLTLAFALPAASHAAPMHHAAPAHHAAAPKATPRTAAAGPAVKPPVADRPFSDVPPNHWAAAAVETLRRRGIVVGYPAESHSAK